MINPKRLLKQLVRLHNKQGDDENWPTLQFEDGRAVFATHVSATGFGQGVGFRFAVPVDQRPRFGALPAALPDGIFSIKAKALATMQAAVAKDTDELLRIEPTTDNGGWVNFRVGTGGVVDLERISSGVVYPLSAMGDRTPMSPEILDELLRLKEVVKLGTDMKPDSFEVLVRIGPAGAESADASRLVIRTSACWPDDLYISGAHLQRAHDLVRKDKSAKLSVAGKYVLLTGQNWELAMPQMKPNSEAPDVSYVVKSKAPPSTKISIDVPGLVAFLQAGRIAAASMKATAPMFVLCLVDGAYVAEYVAQYVTDADKSEGFHRALPLDPWVQPQLEQTIITPASAPKWVSLNPTYLMDALLYVGARTVEVDFAGMLSAVFIHAEDRVGVVMPCRLENFIYGENLDADPVEAKTA